MGKGLMIFTILTIALALGAMAMMDYSALVGMCNSLFRMVIAGSIFLVLLRYMDLRSGIDFQQWWEESSDENRSMYFCARLLALSFIVCACLA